MSQIILHPDEAHLWLAPLDILSTSKPELIDLLSPEERVRAERLQNQTKRMQFITARGLLRYLLSRYLNMPPQSIHFAYHALGKPYILNSTLQFNVSHSGDMAIYAFTHHQPIGVDIQKITHYNDKLAKRFFTKNEYDQLGRLPLEEQAQAFCQLWARKEAIVKAIGGKLLALLPKFSLNLSQSSEKIICNSSQGALWHVVSLDCAPPYHMAYATGPLDKKMRLLYLP